MKQFIVLSAPPGSGKSTWAQKYKAEHQNTLIISSDEVRFELTGQYQDFSKQKEVWELIEKRIVEYSHKEGDFDVIFDALTDLNELRKKYFELAKDYDKRILVEIKKPLNNMQEYNHQRGKEHWVPEDIIISLYNKFEEPSEEIKQLYDQFILVDYVF